MSKVLGYAQQAGNTWSIVADAYNSGSSLFVQNSLSSAASGYVGRFDPDGTYNVGTWAYGPAGLTNSGSAVQPSSLFAGVTLVASGTASAGVPNVGSNALQFQESDWSGSAAVTTSWSINTVPSATPTLGIFYAGTQTANITATVFQVPGAVMPGGQGTPSCGLYSGTGIPTFSAPNGSLFMRFDGTTSTSLYINNSGVSASGTTWTAIAVP